MSTKKAGWVQPPAPQLLPLLVFDDEHIASVTLKSGVIRMRWADTSRHTEVREILETPGVGDHRERSKVDAVIDAMTAKQPGGKAGDLLNDGRGNFFPCGSVLVGVGWSGVYRYWYVHGWSPVDVVNARRRVFSGNLLES